MDQPGASSNDAELWQLINNDYDEFERLQQQFGALRGQFGIDAAASFGLIEEFQTGSKVVPREEKARLIAQKTAEMKSAVGQLRDLSFAVDSAIIRARDNLMTYVVAELAPEEFNRILKDNLASRPLAAYRKLIKEPKSTNAQIFVQQVDLLNRINDTASFVALMKFIHETDTMALPGLLFEKTKGSPVKDISNPALPNWPGIRNCLETVHNIMARIHLELRKPVDKRIFSDKELRRYTRKLALTLPVIFNSPGAKLSKEPRETPDIGVDLLPYQPVPEGLYTAFISPTQYVMAAFRTIVQKYTPYEIVEVDGDGNCFFRAVVRAFFPKISKTWENKLSLALRRSVNTGVERQLKTQGRGDNYQFQGFVIENVNDSVTMAKAGVWADHVQVQKLSALFGCPIRLITYDDIGLKITHEGLINPGSDYVINPHFKREPLTLFFTPTPGHYEAVIPKRYPSKEGEEMQEGTQAPIADLFLQVYQALDRSEPVPAPILSQLYLRFEQEAVRIGGILSELNNTRNDQEMSSVLQVEFSESKNILIGHIIQYTAIISRLGNAYIDSLKEHPDSILYQEILNPLADDTLVFSGNELLNIGKGPLSVLYQTVKNCDPKSGAGISSLFSPLTSLWNHLSGKADGVLGSTSLAETTLEEALRNDDSKSADFMRILSNDHAAKDRIQIKDIRIEPNALSEFFFAVRNLTQRGNRWGSILFLQCKFEYRCAQVLKSRLPTECGVPHIELNTCLVEDQLVSLVRDAPICRFSNCTFSLN